MNSFDFFDEIYCINLDHRTDRWEQIQKEFEKVRILNRVKRFSAIKKDDGRVGCIKSALAIIKIAKAKGLNNVLIFEDDVKFIVKNPEKHLKKAISQIGNLDWYLFYLGANTHEKLTKIKPNLILLKNGRATHTLAYNKKIFGTIIQRYEGIETINKFQDILDVYLADQIQSKHMCLMVNPMLTTQISDYSDIEKHIMNQSYIEERFEKNIQEEKIFKKLFRNMKKLSIEYFNLLEQVAASLKIPFPKKFGKWLKKRGVRIEIPNNKKS